MPLAASCSVTASASVVVRGEVGGGPARRDDVLHSTALAGTEQHLQAILALLSVVELGDQVEASCFGIVLHQLPLPGQLEGVVGRAIEDGDRPIAHLAVPRGGGYGGEHGQVLISCVRCCLCCHLCPPLVFLTLYPLFCVSPLSIDAQMDGKVQSGFHLTSGGNLRVSAWIATWWLSAERNIHLTPSYFASSDGMLLRFSFLVEICLLLVCQTNWLLGCGVGMAAGPPWIRVGSWSRRMTRKRSRSRPVLWAMARSRRWRLRSVGTSQTTSGKTPPSLA